MSAPLMSLIDGAVNHEMPATSVELRPEDPRPGGEPGCVRSLGLAAIWGWVPGGRLRGRSPSGAGRYR
jgi:hypothetical protein